MMHSMTLNIKDEFYPEFKEIVDSFVAKNKLEYRLPNNINTIRDDIEISLKEIAHGRVYRVDEAFDSVLAKYAD
ncbi:MAG: hypothetical protein JXQ76_10775 [Campylobacterales bacterium]|nr:hypothetical protein [Campylobacterales bacterium]